MCNNFCYALTYLPFFSFKCYESVVLYILLLKEASELSYFCKMARRSKVVGLRRFKLNQTNRAKVLQFCLEFSQTYGDLQRVTLRLSCAFGNVGDLMYFFRRLRLCQVF